EGTRCRIVAGVKSIRCRGRGLFLGALPGGMEKRIVRASYGGQYRLWRGESFKKNCTASATDNTSPGTTCGPEGRGAVRQPPDPGGARWKALLTRLWSPSSSSSLWHCCHTCLARSWSGETSHSPRSPKSVIFRSTIQTFRKKSPVFFERPLRR